MKIKKTLVITIPFLALALIYGLAVNLLFDISVTVILKYIITQCFVILLPGLVCTKFLFGRKEHSIIKWISLGYVFGYSINIIEYIMIWSLKLQNYAFIIIILMTILFIFLWFYSPIEIVFDKINSNDVILLFFFMIYLLISIISYSGNNVSAITRFDVTNITRDVQFWCSNAVSLKNNFLPQSAFFSGTNLYYHYFSSMHVAFISQISGISIFNIAFPLYPFGKCILLIGGLNFLIDKYKIGNIKLIFLSSILLMTGWEVSSIVSYVWHLTYNPFGFDIGFAYGFWFVALLLNTYESEKFNFKNYISLMLIWLTLCGTKGPIAILLLIIPGINCFASLLKKKYKIALSYGIAYLTIFAITNIFCVGILRLINHTTEEDGVGKLKTINEILINTPFSLKVVNIIPAFVWIAFKTHPFLFLITSINTILLIKLLFQHKISLKEIFKLGTFFITTIIGLIIGFCFRIPGHSEMYFTMAAYIPCITYNLELYNLLFNKQENKRTDLLYKLTLLSISFIGYFCWIHTDWVGGIIVPLKSGFNNITATGEYNHELESFTKREANACEWIRNNTPNESIIQSNRYLLYPTDNYYVNIFSERVQYLEASDLINNCDLGIEEKHIEKSEINRRSSLIERAYDGDKVALNQLVDEGVTYFIQDNLICCDYLKYMELVPVYDYDDIVIYKAK